MPWPDAPLAGMRRACDPERQKRCGELTGRVNGSVQEVRDLTDGDAFHFFSEATVCQEVMEFATLERLCCPFFTFRLELLPNRGLLVLSLTGPTGAKEILRNFLRGDAQA